MRHYQLYTSEFDPPSAICPEIIGKTWRWLGSYPTLHLAQEAQQRLAKQPFPLKRWMLFVSQGIRPSIEHLHSEGVFPTNANSDVQF